MGDKGKEVFVQIQKKGDETLTRVLHEDGEGSKTNLET